VRDLPDDPFLNAILVILTPIFLPFVDDPALARDAALVAIDRMRIDTQADLLTIAQAIAFGIGSVRMLTLSLTPDLDTVLLLRIGNAATNLSRIEARHRRAAQDPAIAPPSRSRPTPPERPTPQPPQRACAEEQPQRARAEEQPQPSRAEAPPATPAPTQPTERPESAPRQEIQRQSPAGQKQPPANKPAPQSIDAFIDRAAELIYGKKGTVLPPSLNAPSGPAKAATLRSSLLSSVASAPMLPPAPPAKGSKA
jgi:hypothetical protein